MPYNNTPIAPSKEVTGQVSLPLARVKKIIATDDDISNCSNNAAFMITIAAEMFLQHLVEQSYNVVKSERKPRRNIQYRDVANAVSRVENLEFLSDVVPKTVTYKVHKQKAKGTTVDNSINIDSEEAGPAPPPAPARGDQMSIQDSMTGRVVRAEEHAASPQVVIPKNEAIEVQAMNGAARHEDAMDVDEAQAGSSAGSSPTGPVQCGIS